MDELKNLVIQTLETNGILGQLRAQLRSCVFKVIDNQDQVEKGQGSGFHWENPQARKVIQSASGMLCAELVRDFLESYKLDYTLSIYMPEVNLNSKQPMSKDELSSKIGLNDPEPQKPLLVQLLESFMSGDHSATNTKPVYAPPTQPEKKEEQKVVPQQQQQQNTSQISQKSNDYSSHSITEKTQPKQDSFTKNKEDKEENKYEKRVGQASKMLADQQKEEKQGYNISMSSMQNKKNEDNIIDTYGDDFEEEIDEELPEENNLLDSAGDGNRGNGIGQSLGGITVSQSLGVDPSVDSLALEDYDHVEPVERIV